MPLFIINEKDESLLSDAVASVLEEMVTAVLREEALRGEDLEVTLLLVDDAHMQELNFQYRGINAPTDVLSFSQWESVPEEPQYEDPAGEALLGDIVIAVETAARQGQEKGHTLVEEIMFLTIHGLLHLLGYDHGEPEEEAKMWARQEEIWQRWLPVLKERENRKTGE